MLGESVLHLYQKLRLDSYRKLFGTVHEREGSLSATEAFAADVIHLLGEPTIGQFADYIGVSQPNATYKVNGLVAKGYVEKVTPESDRREVHLQTCGKYSAYFDENRSQLDHAVKTVKKTFSEEEIRTAIRVLDALAADMDGV